MIELEKKWLLKECPQLHLAYGFEFTKGEIITQSYLSETERIRMIEDPFGKEALKYQHFFKTKVGSGSCVEEVKVITEAEYEAYHKKAISEILKQRGTFTDPDTKLHYEVDLLDFDFPRVPIVLLEIEFQDRYKTMKEVDESFQLPGFMSKYVLMDVTDNRNFSNYSLSEIIEDGEEN